MTLRFDWVDAVVGKLGLVGPRGKAERHVALTLAAFMDDNGWCWPSIEMLVEATERSRSNVFRILKSLESQGWIERLPGGGKLSTRYRAVFPNATGGVASTPREGWRLRHGGSVIHATQTPQGTPQRNTPKNTPPEDLKEARDARWRPNGDWQIGTMPRHGQVTFCFECDGLVGAGTKVRWQPESAFVIHESCATATTRAERMHA